MSNLPNLRARVEAVTKNLSELDHLEKDQSQRLHEALDNLRDSFRSKQAEIKEKLDQIAKLTQENEELQKLLNEVLGFIERKDAEGFNKFLSGLDQKLAEIAVLGSAAPSLHEEPLESIAVEAVPEERVPASTLEVKNLLEEDLADEPGQTYSPDSTQVQPADETAIAPEPHTEPAESEAPESAAELAREVKDSLDALEEAIYGSDVDEELTLAQDAVAEKPEMADKAESKSPEAEIAELASLQPTYAEKRAEKSETASSGNQEDDGEDSSIFDILQRAHAVVRSR
jgi:hypothetical protein